MEKSKAPILILKASQQPYLSIGRFYGGIQAYGYYYTYLPVKDAFLREDYVKEYSTYTKKGNSWESFIEYIKSIK